MASRGYRRHCQRTEFSVAGAWRGQQGRGDMACNRPCGHVKLVGKDRQVLSTGFPEVHSGCSVGSGLVREEPGVGQEDAWGCPSNLMSGAAA